MGGIFAIFVVPVRFLTVMIAITSASMIVTITARPTEQPFDPFAAYVDILPGKPLDSTYRHGFKCNSIYSAVSLRESCSTTLKIGIFSDIEVLNIPYTGLISRVVFRPHENLLLLGDLILLWGKPDITFFNRMAHLRWRDRGVVAILQTNRRHLSYWAPISYVAFEEGD